jgi:hypothetical protein
MTTTDNPKSFGFSAASARAKGETRMYYILTVTFAALTVFTPTFIAMRDRTNASWRMR